MSNAIKNEVKVPIHPELTTIEQIEALPEGAIISMEGLDVPLFDFDSKSKRITRLFDEGWDPEYFTAVDALEMYAPVRMVWVSSI